MTQPKISLSFLNDHGAIASIEDDDMNDVAIYQSYTNKSAKTACTQAAKRLRILAKAFENLALMDKPFTESAHVAAMRQARKDVNSAPAPEAP